MKEQVFNLNNTGTCKKILRPSLDTLPLLGVNTLDVMLVEQHITGQALLANPYRIIAADVNRDGQLNAADLDAMNNLIVGTANTFPGNKSWRFVPSSFVFPNPAQPLSNIFPEKISTVCPAPSGLNQHFTAIKTGDVNGSALTSSRGEHWVIFNAEQQRFTAGDELEVSIRTPELSNVAGFQFTLDIDPVFLTLQGVISGTIPTRVGLFLEQNRLAASWYSSKVIESVDTVFVLKFKALQTGTLSQAIQMSSAVAQAEAYDRNFKSAYAALQFNRAEARSEDHTLATDLSAILFPISPNPSIGPVEAVFFLPQSGRATLTLSDVNGWIVAKESGYFEKGNHRMTMEAGISGFMFLTLHSAYGTVVQRVLVNRN